jgi:predicted dehydrogenase
MLKVGIVGLGGIAITHLRDIARIPDEVRVVAVADLLEAPRRRAMEEFGIARGYASHTELLKDDEVQAVAIVLGHQLHHRLTVDALNAGKHVLVEKPMALSLEHCDEMIAAAHANGVKLMVGLTQHFHPTAMKAKEILDSGELGPVITAVSYMSKNWTFASRPPQYRSRFHGGGMWLGNGVHEVDRLTWMMGSQAMSVSASIGTRAHYQAADDYGTAFIRYKNGTAGTVIAVGYRDGGPNFSCEVICANGTLRFSANYEKYVRLGRGEQWEDVEFDRDTPAFANEWRAFAECIARDIEPAASGEYGRHIMEILFAAEESALTNREVPLQDAHRWAYQKAGVPVTRSHGWV